ncbi:MAG: cobalamin-dependent protein [Phycisphaerales bacterium]|nr:MAG: cobalamin-dependent protein [Phycisphaerales bacterium]
MDKLAKDQLGLDDILLINPPWVSKDQNVWHGIKGAMPPLGLLSIAAYLQRKGHSVRIIDLHIERWSIDRFRVELQTCEPRHVGISVMTSTAIAANRIARVVKEVHPNCVVVVGGVHAEAMPAECLRNSAIDAAVRGDGELTFEKIVAGEPFEQIRGISFRRGNRAVHNPAAEVIKDLDSLPMPAYDLVPMKKYFPTIGAYRRLPAINMLMTRGCPGKCTFCNSAETTLRTRTADQVVDELAYLRQTYGIREIQFYDDTFTIFKKNVLRFCELMEKRKLGISWTAFARTDSFSEEMAKALKRGGCHQIMFGVESGDDEILKNIRKPVDRERTRWAVRTAQNAGLEVRATFMLGNPGETVESMQRTIAYALRLDPDLAIFNITTPYPGTEMFKWAKTNGLLNTEDWGEYELSRAIMTLPTVSPEQIAEAYSRAHRVFYNRPIMIARRLKRIRNISQLKDNIHAFFYIVLRRSIGQRDYTRLEWIDGFKENFWDVPIEDPVFDGRLIRTSEMQRGKLGLFELGDVAERKDTAEPIITPTPMNSV